MACQVSELMKPHEPGISQSTTTHERSGRKGKNSIEVWTYLDLIHPQLPKPQANSRRSQQISELGETLSRDDSATHLMQLWDSCVAVKSTLWTNDEQAVSKQTQAKGEVEVEPVTRCAGNFKHEFELRLNILGIVDFPVHVAVAGRFLSRCR